MEATNLDTGSSRASPDEELLSLAFDCTEMVTELSKVYRMERQGDHESARSAIGTVERQIDEWMVKLDRLNPEGVDKEKLSRDLEEAREALKLDL